LDLSSSSRLRITRSLHPRLELCLKAADDAARELRDTRLRLGEDVGRYIEAAAKRPGRLEACPAGRASLPAI